MISNKGAVSGGYPCPTPVVILVLISRYCCSFRPEVESVGVGAAEPPSKPPPPFRESGQSDGGNKPYSRIMIVVVWMALFTGRRGGRNMAG